MQSARCQLRSAWLAVAQGHDLGMRGGVSLRLALIPAAADDLATRVKHHRPDWHLVGRARGCRLGEGLHHGRLEAGQVAGHSVVSRSGTERRVESALERLAESNPPGQACQHLVREEVQVTG